MQHPGSGCPNCGAQINVWEWGFKCSICKYDHEQWAAFLAYGHPDLRNVAAIVAKYPLHTDSPALRKIEAERASHTKEW